MKKILFYGIALLTACTMMVACQPKNEPQTPTDPQEPEQKEDTTKVTAVAALFDFQITVTSEMLEVADFTINFYDKNGQLQTEQMVTTKWDSIIVAKLPAKLGVQVNVALKPDFDSTKYDVFNAVRDFTYIAYAVGSDGKQMDSEQPFHNYGTNSMSGAEIEAFFNRYKEKAFVQRLYTFDEEGNKTYHSEWE